jgi:hypothetical protein
LKLKLKIEIIFSGVFKVDMMSSRYRKTRKKTLVLY